MINLRSFSFLPRRFCRKLCCHFSSLNHFSCYVWKYRNEKLAGPWILNTFFPSSPSLFTALFCEAFKTQFFPFLYCHYRELQNASGEWMNTEAVRTPPRRGSVTQGYIPTADIIRKSISRSWTISSECWELLWGSLRL